MEYIRKEAAHSLVAGDADLRKLLIRAIREAHLSPEALAMLIKPDEFANPAHWLDEELLAPLLADFFLAKHPGACEAMDVLLKTPRSVHSDISSLVNPRLGNKVVS